MKVKVIFISILLLSGKISYSQTLPEDSLVDRITSLEKTVRKLNNVKISGYIQGQYQNGQEEALSLKVGDPINEKPGEQNISRMGIRRGRIKIAYEETIFSGVFQLDITEKNIGVKDAYFQAKDPWTQSSYFRAGVYNRPFGFEVAYSSSLRESPERATVNQWLFPDERDLGAGILLQPKPGSPLDFLKLQAGIFAGNGIRIDTDNRKDFMGHLSAHHSEGKVLQLGLGISYYNGSVWNPTNKTYQMSQSVFQSKTVEPGSYSKREYFGIDGQIAWHTDWGTTRLRGEYLWGVQPGTILSSKSPNYASQAVWTAEVMAKNGDGLYIRDFMGYYIHLIQDIGQTPFKLSLKYDYYDPNTKLEANQVDVAGSNSSFADLAVSTLGFGGIYDWNNNFRIMAYYEVNHNESAINAISDHSTLYNHERKDNVFTLRLQYKF